MTTLNLEGIDIDREARLFEASRMSSRGVKWVGRRRLCQYDRHNKMLFMFFRDFTRRNRGQWLLKGVREILRNRSMDEPWRTDAFFTEYSRCVIRGIDTTKLAQSIAREVEAMVA